MHVRQAIAVMNGWDPFLFVKDKSNVEHKQFKYGAKSVNPIKNITIKKPAE